MIWRGDTDIIYVLFKDNNLLDVVEMEGITVDMPDGDPDIEPPDGLVQPVRGFGWVWRNGSEVRERLGWATELEKGYDSPVQDFEGGTIIRTGGSVYVLLRANGGAARWLRR